MRASRCKNEALVAVAERYAVKTTPFLERLMEGAGPDDPVVRQFRPSAAELETDLEERFDPTADEAKSPLPGLVHRYPDRVLLKPTHICAAYCRFCFRREMVGPGSKAMTDAQLDAALAYVASRPTIWEAVVSGGDPLLLSPRRLWRIVTGLDAVPHVGVVRFHTRLPIHDPERIGDDLLKALTAAKASAVWVVVHVNHVRELAPEVDKALSRFIEAGIPLLSQTVLLKGVNADPSSLEALFRGCVVRKIKPYYLHHPDPARGTGHFRLSLAEGRFLLKALRERLSGIAQPVYVLERPDGAGKVPVGPQWPKDWGPTDREGAETCAPEKNRE